MTGSFALAIAIAAAAGHAPAQAQIVLADQTEAAGLTAVHWMDENAIPLLQDWMTGGVAVGDFNNDGAPDIFWIGGGLARDKLFINDGAGVFTDEAEAWGLAEPHCGNGVSVGDYDGDGWLDIYVTSFGLPGMPLPGTHRLYRNNGDADAPGFVDVAVAAGVNQTVHSPANASGYGSAFGDVDLDGDLDLMVTSWWGTTEGTRLFRNDDDGTFTDVTAAMLGTAVDGVWGFQPAFVDMDGDRYPEILLAADFEDSRYLINNADGTFTDHTVASGTGLDDNGMGQTVGDFDLDGRFDWYVTSIHDEDPLKGNNPGNMLYMAQGDHVFLESSRDAMVNDGGWGWGTIAVDLDHDTRLDIVAVNGRPAKGSQWIDERGKLFHNTGDGTFAEIAETAGFDHTDEGRGVAYLDGDLDGDLDFLVSTNSGPLRYYRNDTNGGSWLRVNLDTSPNPLLAPNGFGTRVIATVDGQAQMRYMSGSPSYLSTSELAMHFGLADADVVDELRIEWSRGQVTTMTGVPVDQQLVVSAPVAADLNADGVVDRDDLTELLAAWGSCPEAPAPCVADQDGDGVVGSLDLLMLLANWG